MAPRAPSVPALPAGASGWAPYAPSEALSIPGASPSLPDLPELSAGEAYVREKLSQATRMEGAAVDDAKIRAIERLARSWDGTLSRQPDAVWASESTVRGAALRGASRAFEGAPRASAEADLAPTPVLDPAAQASSRRLERLAEEIEGLRAKAGEAFQRRQERQSALEGAARVRSSALAGRRGGSERHEFQKDFSRLAMVMDLSYSLNILESAETALVGMQKQLDEKLQKIAASERENAAGRAAAEERLAQIPQWRAQAERDLAASKGQGSDLAELAQQAEEALRRIPAFRASLEALLAEMDRADGREGRSAVQEYEYRLERRIPQLIDFRINGYPGAGTLDTSKLSLQGLRTQLADVQKKIADVEKGLPRLTDDSQVPTNTAAVLIIEVPGLPANTDPYLDRAGLLALLQERKRLFEADRESYGSQLEGVERSMDPSNSRPAEDDFGDPIFESHAYWMAQEEKAAAKERGETEKRLRKIDEAAARVRAAAPSADLPSLAGKSRAELVKVLPEYLTSLDRIVPPPQGASSGQEGDPAFTVTMAKLEVATELPWAAWHLLRWSKAEETAKALKEAVNEILPITRTRLSQIVALNARMLADVEQDSALVQSRDLKTAPLSEAEALALIARKRALVLEETLPTLKAAQALLEKVLIPFQERSIESLREIPGQDGLPTLFRKSKELYDKTEKGLHKTFPWQLASNGGLEDDERGSLIKIDERAAFFEDNLRTVLDNQADLDKRTSKTFAGKEPTLGREMDYSLPKRIDAYAAEKARYARAWNATAKELNLLLARIDAGTSGRHRLAERFAMPVDVAESGERSVGAIKAILEGTMLKDLGALLDSIGKSADLSGGVDLGTGEGVPTGEKPPVTLTPSQQLALDALQAAKRLVPSTAGVGALSLAGAEYLFADGVESASRRFLEERVPKARAFLALGRSVLEASLEDLGVDRVYVGSRGASESFTRLYDRKLTILGRQREFARAGRDFFETEKAVWDREFIDGLGDIEKLYEGLRDLRTAGGEVDATERRAVESIKKVLDAKLAEFRDEKRRVLGWLKQLNSPNESALRRVAERAAAIQEKTRKVLEANFDFRGAESEFKEADAGLRAAAGELERKRMELERELLKAEGREMAPGAMEKARAALSGGAGGAWALGGPKGSKSSLVLPRVRLPEFVDRLLQGLFGETMVPGRDIETLKRQILADPAGLASLVPGAHLMEFGDGDEGFYLLYQSEFGVPGGLETGSRVVFGNLVKAWGSNVSLSGHRFASPPSDGNAPYGDQGVTVGVESLEGASTVNYLDVTFHRWLQDVPAGQRFDDQAKQMRLMVFEDFAMLLAGDRLYIGFTGYGDIANPMSAGDWKDRPRFAGANLKSELKLTEAVRLTAEQQSLLAEDPRRFLQTIDLDFTGMDRDLSRTWVIEGRGETKRYSRTKGGIGVDLGQAAGLTGGTLKTLDLELYWARVRGTDDYDQDAVGASVLTGISLGGGVRLRNRAAVERGSHHDTYADRLDIELPVGLAFFAEGKLVGEETARRIGLSKRLGSNTQAELSYGSPYVGLPDRLSLSLGTSFRLSELWSDAAADSAKELLGGKALERAQARLAALLEGEDAVGRQELVRVFQKDVARRLLAQDIGRLSKEMEELHKAGAILDNTRMKGMIGFVSNGVGESGADRAFGGGFQMGASTELTLTRSQKALVEKKAASILRESLRLQRRLAELTKAWQRAALEALTAGWQLALGETLLARATTPAARAEARVRVEENRARLRQAVLAYNLLTGRPPEAALPFDGLPLEEALAGIEEMETMVSAPDGLSRVFSALGEGEMRRALPQAPFNVVDLLPLVERVSAGFGFQLQDALGNQALGAGASIRIPVYDPSSDARDRSYKLEGAAALEEARGLYDAYRLEAQKERIEAVAWRRQAVYAAAQQPEAGEALRQALSAHRNALLPESELWEAARRYEAATRAVVEARGRGAQARAGARLDGGLAGADPRSGGLSGLSEALAALRGLREGGKGPHPWPKLSELALRTQAAAEARASAAAHVPFLPGAQKLSAELHAGLNLTASGLGFLPALGLTGLGLAPSLVVKLRPVELRELEVKEGEERTRLQRALEAKVRSDLALALFENYLAVLHGHAEEGALRDAGVDGLVVLEVQRRKEEALASYNFLLGRPLSEPVALALSAGEALSAVEAYLKEEDPPAARKTILEARLEAARAYERIVDTDLRAEETTFEPVSLLMRSLGRLIRALAEEPYASPERVAHARTQVLLAEREKAAFAKAFPGLKAAMQGAAARAAAELRRLEGERGPGAEAARERARQAYGLARARLAALGGAAPSTEEAAPVKDFDDLSGRLTAQAKAEAAGALAGEEVPGLGTRVPSGRSSMRYYFLQRSLDSETIGRAFIETWAELRLASPDAEPEEVSRLLAAARERDERRQQSVESAAELQARVELARFSAETRLWRAARASKEPGSPELARNLELSLRGQAETMAGRLLLPSKDAFERLAALVPATPPEALDSAGRGFLEELKRADAELARRVLYGATAGRPADTESQLRADAIAGQMSVRGFTPIAAAGLFRDRFAAGLFLEAPDPGQVRKGLAGLLGQALRRELESRGELDRLAGRLHALLAAVRDGARLAEVRQARVRASRERYAAVLAAVARGALPAPEEAAARKEAATALKELAQGLAELRATFEELVLELEALGLSGQWAAARGAVAPPPIEDRPSDPVRASPMARLLEHWVERTLDEGFRARQGALLASLGFDPALTVKVEAAMQEHAFVAERARLLRAMALPAPEKLRLLSLADEEGRRARLRETLQGLLEAPQGRGLQAFLLEDLRGRQSAERERRRADDGTLDAIRDAYWRALPADRAAEAMRARLEPKIRAERDAWRELAEAFLEGPKDAEGFARRDARLDAYLQARLALDREVLQAFASPALRRRPDLARALDAWADFQGAARRSAEYLRRGRGALALQAMVRLGEARVAAARLSGAPAAERDEAAGDLARLEAMSRRWQEGPRRIEPLYAATKVDRSGRRTWDVASWLDGKDLEEFDRGGRLVSVEGRSWLLPAAGPAPRDAREAARRGALELIGGVDADKKREREQERARLEEERRYALGQLLARSPFAVDGGDAPSALSAAAFERAVAEGRVVFLDAKADGNGLRRRLHPLQTLWRGSGDWVALIQEATDAAAPRGLESLEALKAAGWAPVKVGQGGLDALIAEGEKREARLLRAGWTAFKLHAHSARLDEEGLPVELFTDAAELAEARKREPKGRFVTGAELRWGLAADGTLSAVEAPGFALKLPGPKAERWVAGKVLAVELDKDGRIKRVLSEQKQLELAAREWAIVDANADLAGKERTLSGQERVRPLLRLKRYESEDGERSVVLAREALAARLGRMEKELGAIQRWAYMPGRWPDLLLETPRGLIKAPLELFTSADPRQQGYLGRVQMLRTEGGATQKRGFWLSLAHFVDFLDVLPDPVRRFHDPSQFPPTVELEGGLPDSGFVFDAEASNGDELIHLGREALRREIDRAREAMDGRPDAAGLLRGGLRDVVASHFDGGVQREWLETRRGRGADWRGGSWRDGRGETLSGHGELDSALGDPRWARTPGERAVVDERPDNLELERLEGRLEARVGLRQVRQGLARLREERRALQTPAPEESVRSDATPDRERAPEARELAEMQEWDVSLDTPAEEAPALPAPRTLRAGGEAKLPEFQPPAASPSMPRAEREAMDRVSVFLVEQRWLDKSPAGGAALQAAWARKPAAARKLAAYLQGPGASGSARRKLAQAMAEQGRALSLDGWLERGAAASR